MSTTTEEILNKIKLLEQELIKEVQNQQQDFINNVDENRKNASLQGQNQMQQFSDYLKKASIKNIISSPFIWSVILPVLLLDLTVSIYQAVCFPIYGIPKVKHSDYIVFDRQLLNYLNLMEKINCGYCSYFNGAIAYIQEVAARTEQYWCPIKYAKKVSTLHSRYQHFIDYGDAESFRQHKENVRRNFKDLEH